MANTMRETHCPDGRAVPKAIADIPETAWVSIKYPKAIFDDEQQRWISDAQVADTTYTAFESLSRSAEAEHRDHAIVEQVIADLGEAGGRRARAACAPGSVERTGHLEHSLLLVRQHGNLRRAAPRPPLDDAGRGLTVVDGAEPALRPS